MLCFKPDLPGEPTARLIFLAVATERWSGRRLRAARSPALARLLAQGAIPVKRGRDYGKYVGEAQIPLWAERTMPQCKPVRTGFALLPTGITRLFCAFVLLLPIYCAHALTWTWNGNGGNVNWSTGGNWNTGTAPSSASTTDLIFAGSNNTGTALVPLNQNIASPFQLNTLTFSGTAGTFFLGGNAFAFTGATNSITQSSSNAQSIANNITASTNSMVTLTLTGAGSGTLTLSGNITAGSGNRDYAIVKSGSSTFSLTGTNTYTGGTTINGGTLIVNSASSLGTGTLNLNAGTLEVATGFTTSRTIVLGNAASTIRVDASQTYTVTSSISGAGGLTKTGAGILTLNGAANNTYTGTTTVNQGTLILAKPGSVLAPAITIGGAGSSATVQIGADFQLYGANATINSQGQLNLNNFQEYVGTLTLNGGAVVTGTGLLYIGSGGIVSTSSTTLATLSGYFSLVTNQIFNIASGSTGTGVDVTISGSIAEWVAGATVTKQGSGTLVLSGANSYTGLTTVSSGVLNIQNSSALGTTAAGTNVAAGAALQIQGNIVVANEALTLNGSGVSSDGAFRNISGNNSVAGAITLGSASTIASDSGTLTLTGGITNGGFATTFAGAGNISESGIISGTGGIAKTGSGTSTLSGANTYSGLTTISAGTLQVNVNNALGGAASGTTVASGASLKLNNVNYATAEALTLNGSGISNGGALTNSGTSTFAGAINIATNATINAGGGTLNLTGGLSKNGTTLTIAGGGTVNITTNGITGSSPNSDLVVDGTTVVLSAANSYNGPTTIQNSGTLKLGNNNVLPTSPQTALTINTSSVFDLASYSDGVASLAGDTTGIVRNSIVGGTSTLTVNPANGVSTTFSGVIAGTNGGTQGNVTLQKNGLGTLILTGTNSYGGATTVNGGTLTVANNSGSALGSTSAITVNSGGTLRLGASDQINNTAPITLAGGTFAKGNFSEGGTQAAGVGQLTLTASGSTLDFGTGTVGVLTFASLSPGSFTLTINNWTGTVATEGGPATDRLIFNSDQSANLSSFNFAGYAPGAIEFNLGNGFYEIVPAAVPEPSTWIAGALTVAVIGCNVVRRRRKRHAK